MERVHVQVIDTLGSRIKKKTFFAFEFDNPRDCNYQLVSSQILETARTVQRLGSWGTLLFCVPNPQNPDFISREDILEDMKKIPVPKLGLSTRLGLWGLGGIGNSQLLQDLCTLSETIIEARRFCAMGSCSESSKI